MQSKSKRVGQIRRDLKIESGTPQAIVGRTVDQPGVTPRLISLDRALAAGPAVRRVQGRGV